LDLKQRVGGLSGRFGGYRYGFGHCGVAVLDAMFFYPFKDVWRKK